MHRISKFFNAGHLVLLLLLALQNIDARFRVKSLNITADDLSVIESKNNTEPIGLHPENDNQRINQLPICTLSHNNEPASSSVNVVYETTPSSQVIATETTMLPEREIEPSYHDVPKKYSAKRLSRNKTVVGGGDSEAQPKTLPEKVHEEPQKALWNINDTDWTSRIFQRGQTLAQKARRTMPKDVTVDVPVTPKAVPVSTERSRTRYGWRIRKRNKKVIGDEEVGNPTTENITLENDAAAHHTVVHNYSTESPEHTDVSSEAPKRKLSARYKKPNVEVITPETADVVDSSASSQHQDEVADNNAKAVEKSEDGSGGLKESANQNSHGEKSKKGFSSNEKDEKVGKGHHDKEQHKGDYDDAKGSKHSHEDQDGHYQSEDEDEGGKKGANHEEHESYKKGHSTHGGHVVHKKDEYEKKTEFFDEDDDDGHGEKYGEYHEDHEGKNGGHNKKEHLDGAHDEAHKSDKGHYNKASYHSEDQGKHEKEGKTKFYDHHHTYGTKTNHAAREQFGKSPNSHLVQGDGQVAITSQQLLDSDKQVDYADQYDDSEEEKSSDYKDDSPDLEELNSEENESLINADYDENENYEASEMEGPMKEGSATINQKQLPHLDREPTRNYLPWNARSLTIGQSLPLNSPATSLATQENPYLPSRSANYYQQLPMQQSYQQFRSNYHLPDKSLIEVLELRENRGAAPKNKAHTPESEVLSAHMRYKKTPIVPQNEAAYSYQVATTYYPVSITTGSM